MTAKEVEKEYQKFKKRPKVRLKETPAKFEYIVELFVVKEETKGGLVLNDSLLDKVEKKYKIQPYPYAQVLKAGPGGDYEEGDIIYLDDEILEVQDNPEWNGWARKLENQHPTPYEPEPPRYLGGLYYLHPFRYKVNKFDKDTVEEKFVYQIPQRIIKGVREKSEKK